MTLFGILDLSTFYFKWPWALILLVFLPFFPLIYLKLEKERWKRALRFSYASVAAQVRRNSPGWKRLVIPLMLFLAVSLLIVSLARPTMTVRVPKQSVDIILVLDISISMLAEDIEPSRIEAARESAIRFAGSLPKDVRLGLSFFAGSSYIISPPTEDHRKIRNLLASLDKDDLEEGTAIGGAIQTALRALEDGQRQPASMTTPDSTGEDTQPQRVIVLLSDGDQQIGYPWQQAALNAREQNVVIHTVGIGSREGGFIYYNNQRLAVILNEFTLRQIAEMTEGSYHRAFEEKDFRRIYDEVRERSIQWINQDEDLGFLFSALALLLLLGQQMLGVFWLGRFP